LETRPAASGGAAATERAANVSRAMTSKRVRMRLP